MAGSFGTKRCGCCPAPPPGECCTNIRIAGAAAGVEFCPVCSVPSTFTDELDLSVFGAPGDVLTMPVASTSDLGASIQIAATDGQLFTVGTTGAAPYSAAMCDGEYLIYTTGTVITINIVAPDGYRVCEARVAFGAANPGSHSTTVDMTDTGGSDTDTVNTTHGTFTTCDNSNPTARASAAGGESVTQLKITMPGGAGGFAVGKIWLCTRPV